MDHRFITAAGFTADTERLTLHREAAQLADALGIGYLDAAARVELAWRTPIAPEGFAFDAERLDTHLTAMRLMASGKGSDYLAAALIAEQTGPVTVTLRQGAAGETIVHLRATVAMGPNETFAGLAYSGGPVSLGYDGPFAIDLASLQLPAGGRVAILKNHNPDAIAGSARADVGGGMLHIADGRFSAATEAGREAAGLHSEGHPLGLSIGVSGRRETLRSDTPTTINGRQQMLGSVMRDARLLEVSLVPSGADPSAHLFPRGN